MKNDKIKELKDNEIEAVTGGFSVPKPYIFPENCNENIGHDMSLAVKPSETVGNDGSRYVGYEIFFY